MSTTAQAIRRTLHPPSQTVLVVDSDRDTREMLRVWLEMCGLRVLEAASGAEAVNLAAESPPDLVTMDMWLCWFDGYEVCRQLRENPLTRLTPIVALTSAAMPKEVERAFQVGCNAVLVKPCSLADVQRTISRLLLVAS